MTAVEVLRAVSLLVWVALLGVLWKPARNVIKLGTQARPLDMVMSSVWLLCLNRVTFTVVSQYAPDDDGALAFCYAFAFAGGLHMLLMCSLAKHRG